MLRLSNAEIAHLVDIADKVDNVDLYLYHDDDADDDDDIHDNDNNKHIDNDDHYGDQCDHKWNYDLS